MNVQISLPLKNWAIPDDIVAAVCEPKEHRHYQGQEQVGWNVKSRREIVPCILGISQHEADQCRQNRRFENGSPKVCPIAQFADKCPPQNRADAHPLVTPACRFLLLAWKRQNGWRFLLQENLAHFLD